MSLWTAVKALATRRPEGPVRRELLDIDAGALMTPTAYPYAGGSSPVRPFASRIVNPGRGPRPLMHLFPPDGNPSQRNQAHVDYVGRAAAMNAGARDVSGNRQPAKITRVRPWLYAGGSSATTADKLAASVASSSSATSGCEGCG